MKKFELIPASRATRNGTNKTSSSGDENGGGGERKGESHSRPRNGTNKTSSSGNEMVQGQLSAHACDKPITRITRDPQ